MKSPDISIIVPVYNSGKWLNRCIDSILAQTYADFEVLLINDGSTDNSPAICDEYAARDSRIRVFHKPNSGVSASRNLGISNSNGEFITFVDSDDWIDAEYLECLHDNIAGADLSICDFEVLGTTERWRQKVQPGFVSSDNFVDFIMKTYPFCYLTAPWIKLFRKSIIDSHNILFNESLDTFEDTVFVLDYLRYVTNISCSDRKLYKYWRESNGLSQNDELRIRQMPVISSCIYSSLCRMAEVRNIEVSMLYILILGRRFYDWVFPRHYGVGQLREHLRSIAALPEIRCLYEGKYRSYKPKYGLILRYLVRGKIGTAARCYRLMKMSGLL